MGWIEFHFGWFFLGKTLSWSNVKGSLTRILEMIYDRVPYKKLFLSEYTLHASFSSICKVKWFRAEGTIQEAFCLYILHASFSSICKVKLAVKEIYKRVPHKKLFSVYFRLFIFLNIQSEIRRKRDKMRTVPCNLSSIFFIIQII